MPIIQLDLMNGPRVCFPRHDLKFSTSICFKYAIVTLRVEKREERQRDKMAARVRSPRSEGPLFPASALTLTRPLFYFKKYIYLKKN